MLHKDGKLKCLRSHTSRAVVLPYPELVQVPGIPDGKLVIIGEDGFLPVLHVNSQLVTALSGDLLDVVETCMEKKTTVGHACDTVYFRVTDLRFCV